MRKQRRWNDKTPVSAAANEKVRNKNKIYKQYYELQQINLEIME